MQLGGRDSSEVWSGFRVGRRARPGPVQAQGWTVDGSHDGYGHLPGRPQHHRRWHFEDAALTVDDRIDPAAAEAAVARFHLAPGLRLEAIDTAGTRWRVLAGATPCASVEVLVGAAQVEPWQHALRFGRLVEASTLAVTLERGAASVRWCWTT